MYLKRRCPLTTRTYTYNNWPDFNKASQESRADAHTACFFLFDDISPVLRILQGVSKNVVTPSFMEETFSKSSVVVAK